VSATVKTQQGKVQGRLCDGVHVFKGITYAAAPFGVNRLRPPQPVAHWSGLRDALTYGPKCPQLPYPPPWDVLLPELVGTGEDCLTLNVWSSSLGSAKQPVMVWIPGGAFEKGTAAMAAYDGRQFARDGIVCVTMNYRVGAEGFLSLDDGIANLGLLDQVAALEWVQQNIAAFGGDPGNVTIFGESAGGMSVGMLLSMPRAKGLFRRAIAQSGGAHQVISAETALRVGRRVAETLGVAATREAIAAVPVERLFKAQVVLKTELATHPDMERWGREMVVSQMLWQPVVDGTVIPAQPIDLIAGGASADIDLMVGSTTDEWRFFLVPGNAIEQITTEILAAAVVAYGLPVNATLAAYRAAHPDASPGDLLAAIQGDWYVRVPVLRLADAHAKIATTSSTHMYEFAWPSPMYNGRLGACHSLEVPFVFDTFSNATEPLLGSAPPQQLADIMHAAWVAFAATGNCGWPTYDSETRATMRFDTNSEVVRVSRSAIQMLWENSLASPMANPR